MTFTSNKENRNPTGTSYQGPTCLLPPQQRTCPREHVPKASARESTVSTSTKETCPKRCSQTSPGQHVVGCGTQPSASWDRIMGHSPRRLARTLQKRRAATWRPRALFQTKETRLPNADSNSQPDPGPKNSPACKTHAGDNWETLSAN